MYYTRHTKVLLKNPFSNDYLRYQPLNFEVVDKKGTITFPKEYESLEEYYQRELYHFFPLIDEQGRKFLDHYTVDDHAIKCQVHKTDDVYVYKLTSDDRRFNVNTNNGYAKIWTYEGTRYLRVLWHKIHIAYKKNVKKDGKQVHPSEIEDKPMFMYCLGVKSKQSKRYVGWTPVMYINSRNNRNNRQKSYKAKHNSKYNSNHNSKYNSKYNKTKSNK
jgi:hypothetical protein